MSSLPKFQFLRRLPDSDLICPICQETFGGEGQTVNEETQVESEPRQATSNTPEATSCQSPTEEATSSQPTAAEATSSQFSTDTDRMLVKACCCNNIFCFNCLVTWLQAANTCPLCRAVLIEGEEFPDDNQEYEPALGPGPFEGNDNNNNYNNDNNNGNGDNHYMDIDSDEYDEENEFDDGFDSEG